MDYIISISGACAAILVAVIGALFSNRNNNVLHIRKLKEEHYISYIESLHNLASAQSRNLNEIAINECMTKYSFFRDKLLIVGSEDVVKAILDFEADLVNSHDKHLNRIIRAIRRDLRIKDKNFPLVSFKK